MKPGRNALPASMSLIPAMRSSLTRRSCKVRLTRSTRPLAWLELAHRISMFSSANARPNWVMPWPPLGFLPGDAEHRVLVGVEGDRAAMGLEIALQGLEIGKGTLRRHEAQLHQPAARIVDEDQQRARVRPILEPAMLAAVDLHELAQGLAAQPWLMEAPALLAREPQAGFGSSSRAASRARPSAHAARPASRPPASGRNPGNARAPARSRSVRTSSRMRLFDGRPRALCATRCRRRSPIGLQQPVHLPRAQRQHHRCRTHRPQPAHHLAQHLDPLQLPLAHRHPPQARSPNHDAAAGE